MIKNQNKSQSRGLTLIELLVTIGVLAIVAAIAVPVITGVSESVRAKAIAETQSEVSEFTKRHSNGGGYTYDPATGILSGYVDLNGDGIATEDEKVEEIFLDESMFNIGIVGDVVPSSPADIDYDNPVNTKFNILDYTLAIAPSSLSVDGWVNNAITPTEVTLDGANGELTWSVIDGELPEGLTLNPQTGVVTGTPTNTYGQNTVTIQVIDGNGAAVTQTHSYSVLPEPTLEPSSLTLAGTVGETLSGSAPTLDGFTQPYTWEVASGNIPDGMSMDSGTGTIDGIPSEPGEFNFSIRLTDANGLTAIQNIAFNSELSCEPDFQIGNSNYTGTINGTYSLPVGQLALVDFTDSCWQKIEVTLSGAGGGHPSKGGRGGLVSGQIQIEDLPNQRFYSAIGTAGQTNTTSPVGNGGQYTVGGYNGGGRGVTNQAGSGNTGGGGGASDIRLNGGSVTNYSSANRILVAGGGGGGTSNTASYGGNGGYPNGAPGEGYGGADGGTQNSGGSLGGSFGRGGENTNNTGWNGGGGGGWYGGGAQKTQHGGGAGGSSYYDSSYISSFSHGLGASRENNGYGTIRILE